MRKAAWAPVQRKLGCNCPKPVMHSMGSFGKTDSASDLGLSLLAITSIFSVHASISPSYATFSSFFSKTPEERAIARETLYLSLGASTLSSLGIYLVFGRLIPAIAAELAGVGLFALGMYAVHKNAPTTPSTMDLRRQEQLNQVPLA